MTTLGEAELTNRQPLKRTKLMSMPSGPSKIRGDIRYSEWRTQNSDPNGLFGWWLRGAWQEATPSRFLEFGFFVSVVLFALKLPFAPLPMILGSVLTVLKIIGMRDHLQPLLSDPAPEGQFRASVQYLREKVITGRDEMALCVVDGWLHAEGVRSGFTLRPKDVLSLETGSDRRGRILLVDGSEIKLQGIYDPVRIALDRWWRSKADLGGESIFPPSRVHAGQFVRWDASFVVAMTLSIVATQTWWLGFDGWSPLGKEIVVVLLCGNYVAGKMNRIWRLRKIDRSMKVASVPPLEPPPRLLFTDPAGRRLEEDRAEVRNTLAE